MQERIKPANFPSRTLYKRTCKVLAGVSTLMFKAQFVTYPGQGKVDDCLRHLAIVQYDRFRGRMAVGFVWRVAVSFRYRTIFRRIRFDTSPRLQCRYGVEDHRSNHGDHEDVSDSLASGLTTSIHCLSPGNV